MERIAQFTEKDYIEHKKRVFSVGWNSDGTTLASASADTSIVVWGLGAAGLRKTAEFCDHTDKVDQVAWSPTDPWLLASASSDKTARIWDVRTRSPVICERAAKDVISLAWSPTESLLAYGSIDNSLTVYDQKAGTNRHQLTFKKDLHAFTWDNTGAAFFVTTGSGEVQTFAGSLESSEPEYVLKAHTSSCHNIAMDPAHPRFATGGSDSIVLLWDLYELTPCNHYLGLDWEIRQISFSFDGMLLATASEDTFVDIIATETCDRYHKINTVAPQYSVAWHPRTYLLAYSGEDRSRVGDMGNIRLFGDFAGS